MGGGEGGGRERKRAESGGIWCNMGKIIIKKLGKWKEYWGGRLGGGREEEGGGGGGV